MTASITPASFVLVPGFWLGAWAWDAVATRLIERGHRVRALTLPGLGPDAENIGSVTLADHVSAVETAVTAAPPPVILVAHSGAAALATAVMDRLPGALARVVFVESGPVADGHVARPDLAPDATEFEVPPWDALALSGVSLDGLDEIQRQEFTRRARPHPTRPTREQISLRDPRRYEVPITLVCCSFPAAAIKQSITANAPMFAPLSDYRNIRWVDLPTGHWPMFSRPIDLAGVLAEEAAHDR